MSVVFDLTPESAAWIVLEGSLDVFFVPDGADGIHGPRRYLFRAEAGDLLAGFAPDAPGGGMLVARGEARLWETSLDRLAADHPDEALARGLDAWIHNLSEVLARPIHPKPVPDLLLPAGGAAGKTVAPARGVLWLEGGDERLFLGMESVPAGEFFFPLTPHTWLKLGEGDEPQTHSTTEIVSRPETWEGLRLFHRLFRACQAENAVFERVDEFLKVRDFLEHTRHSVEKAVDKLQDVVLTGTAAGSATAASLDPLVEAVARVAAAGAIPFSIPKGFRADLCRDPLHALLEATGIRHRKVTLAGNWFHEDNGPLLGFRSTDGRPVALIPRGASGYRLHVPGEPERDVTSEVAATLATQAREFHRPFPDTPLDLRAMFHFGLAGAGRDLGLLLLAGLLAALAGFLPPLFTGVLFEQVIPSSSQGGLLLILLAMMLGALSLGLLGFVRGMALVRLEMRLDGVIQAALWDRILRLPAAFFRGFSVGDLASRAAGMRTLRMVVSGAILTALLSGAFSLANLVFMAVCAPRLLPWALALLAAAVALVMASAPAQVRLHRESQTLRQRLGSLTHQHLQGLPKLRAAGAEGMAFAAWADAFCGLRRLQWRLRSLQARSGILTAVFPALSFAVLYLCAAREFEAHRISLGAFLAFLSAFAATTAALLSVAGSWQQALEAGPALENMRPLLDTPPEEGRGARPYAELRGAVEAAGITFRYAEGSPPVLENVSFRAQPGEFIAIVGPSASGKSTLLRILLGLDRPETGSIYYDGRDLAGLDLSSVRRQIGTVLQNGRLIAGSVLTNITGASPEYTEKDAWEAARLAGIAEDIRDLPMGMSTVITDGGGTFSGGQRQRLLIARALVRRPRILLLDEATSALDNRAQAVVSDSLRRMQVTRIVVAHRLSTVLEADRIVVLQGGRMVETGTYQELMAAGGLFAGLATRQLA